MTEFVARAGSFGGTAEQYERGRPGYPPDLLQRIMDEIGLVRPRILDLGAGTGKLTRQLSHFGQVVAVEPLAEMREQLHLVLADVECLAGTAESIPLADQSVDIVTIGQAYHWFDQSVANPEIWRVLRDQGHLVAMWNFEDSSVGWVAELEAIVSRSDSMAAGRKGRRWHDVFEPAPWFTVPSRFDSSMNVLRTKEQQLANIESHSYLSAKPVEQRRPILDEVAALIAQFPDPFEVPYVTEAYWCRKLPPAES